MSAPRDPLEVLRLIVESDDRRTRQALYIEFCALYDLAMKAERTFMRGAVESVHKTLREYGAARARLTGAKYSGHDREKAVKAINRLRKANPRMSANSAAKRVKATTGIPVRTLSRWASGR